MKTKNYIILIVLILSISIASAETLGSIWGYGFEAGAAKGDNHGNKEQWVPSARAYVQLKLTKQIITRFGVSYARLQATDIYSTKTLMPDARILFIPIEIKGVAPYIYGGFGVSKNLDINDSDFIAMVPMGFGVQTHLSEKVMVELNSGYNLAFSDEFDEKIRSDSQLNRITNKKHDGYFNLMLGITLFNPFTKKTEVTPMQAPTPVEITMIMPEHEQAPAPVKEKEVKPEPVVDPKTIDTDGDGLYDELEITRYNTNPKQADSDGDGLSDGDEILIHGTKPLLADTDGDGLSDGLEVNRYKTNPLKEDTDGDGLSDGLEVNQYKTDPLKADTDGDALNDYAELMTHRTNPLKIDTDAGGMNDGAEIKAGRNPLDSADDLLDLTQGNKIVLEGIQFASAQATILPESAIILEKVQASMLAFPDVKVTIAGHTDSVGSDDNNRTLSLKRAQAVKDWLVAKKISAARIKVVGKGEAEPIATNDTAEGRAKNRRIEFIVD
jgi:outer membrane protein OmpA-like peptidoglycan-associated protein